MIVDQITTAAQKLDPIRQQSALDYLLALLAEQEAEATTVEGPEAIAPVNGKGAAKGWVEVKTINGHQYAYRRYREGKTLKSEYIGKVKI